MLTVNVLVPAYNEARTIVKVLENIERQNIDGFSIEVIVIDDGSTDQTVEILESRPNLYSRLIRRSQNGGKGAAVIDGLMVATADYILFQDADLEYDPHDFKQIFSVVSECGADIVMGSRLSAPPITRVSYFWNKVGNRLITLLFNVLNNTAFTDIYSGYLLYRRTLVAPKSLRAFGWDQQAEILTIASRKTRKLYEVPISYFGRTLEEGKKIRWTAIFKIFYRLISTRLRPLEL